MVVPHEKISPKKDFHVARNFFRKNNYGEVVLNGTTNHQIMPKPALTKFMPKFIISH